MKLAILLSGHIRTYEKTYENFKKIFETHNYDVYSSIWNTCGNITLKNYDLKIDESYMVDKSINDETLKNLNKIYNFKKIELLDWNLFLKENKAKVEDFVKKHKKCKANQIMNSVFGQLSSLINTINLIDNIDDYDIIFKSRYDIEILNKFNFTDIEENKIYVSEVFDNVIPNDFYFYARPNTFIKIKKIIKFLEELNPYNPIDYSKKHNRVYVSEVLLYLFLKENDIEIVPIKNKSTLIR